MRYDEHPNEIVIKGQWGKDGFLEEFLKGFKKLLCVYSNMQINRGLHKWWRRFSIEHLNCSSSSYNLYIWSFRVLSGYLALLFSQYKSICIYWISSNCVLREAPYKPSRKDFPKKNGLWYQHVKIFQEDLDMFPECFLK